MLRFITGAFFVLHGFVHLLYFGQSRRLFELQPGMTWPDSAWSFSKLLGLGDEATRSLASATCGLAALGFMASGLGVFLGRAWWRSVVVGAAAFSAVIFLLFWDGALRQLDNQGAVAILINAAILVAVLVARWPDFGF